MALYPPPSGGASLILSFRFQRRTVLIIGGNSLAASRAFAVLDADSIVVVITRGGEAGACDELKWRAQQQQLTIFDWEALPGPSFSSPEQDASLLETYLTTNPGISLVCITDTISGTAATQKRSKLSAERLVRVCKGRNVPVNVTDLPDLCDFTFTSTHRFQDPETGAPSPLQFGITTNGQGCRLASRLRREIVSTLPKDVGRAALKIGKLREMAKGDILPEAANEAGLSEDSAEATPNVPVPPRSPHETPQEDATRRMKWVAQVSEYWSLQRIADMSEEELADVLNGQTGLSIAHRGSSSNPEDAHSDSVHGLSLTSTAPKGRIFLVGSGPGHPSLLTIATHSALTRHADLVLSDKLVPAAVLELIPKHVEVRIARKFPGNADGAQQELMEVGVEAARRGLTVVRVCQSSFRLQTSINFGVVETGRPNGVWSSRRRSAVLPGPWIRANRRTRSDLSSCGAHLRRNTRNAARRCRVIHCLHWCGSTGEGSQTAGL